MKKILVIEDQQEVRENICEILELTGYQVSAAHHGKEGCAKAVQWGPDLILCDVMMPELDGFGVLKILRKRQDTQAIPLIFLTAKVEPEDLRKGMGLGADDYLMKPFDDTELLDAIELRLKKRESEFERSLEYKSEVGNLRSAERERDKLKDLLEHGDIKQVKTGEELWRPGQEAKGLYFIKEGTVKLFRRHESGKIFMVNYVCADSFLGFRTLFSQQAYRTWAQVDQAVELVFLPAEKVTQSMFEERDIAMFFLRQTIDFSYKLEDRAINYAYSSVRRRVADALLQLCKESKLDGLSVSRDDLAALAGTAKETTIRMLSEFKKEGSINIDGRQIKIIDAKALGKEKY
ncbi:MAG: response regulator [Bacteroidetes bacterium]|jgi:CheY-like chemotaxis protein|nr:response regulator [Bacteroidota bacterium]